MENIDLKRVVKEKYGAIANNPSSAEAACGCSSGCCDKVDYTVFREN